MSLQAFSTANRHFAATVLLVIGSLGVCSVGTAASINDLVRELDAPDYARRQAAQTALMDHPELEDEQLLEIFRSGLGAEQRQRMVRVALHRYYSKVVPVVEEVIGGEGERGALGVTFPPSLNDTTGGRHIVRPDQDPRLNRPAMLITQTFPGFPAFVHLQAGDLVTAINGEGFTVTLNTSEFIARITAFKAGTVVTLDLLRDGKPVQVKFPLGHYTRLRTIDLRLQNLGRVAPELSVDWRGYLEKLAEVSPAESVIRLPFPGPAAGQ